MKKLAISILVCITFLFAIGQDKSVTQNFIEKTTAIKEINNYEDTLWVMDSSYNYNSINNELQLTSTYNIIARDDQGNKVLALGKGLTSWGEMVNSYLDSVTYFDATSDINHVVTSSWNYKYGIWVDNKFQLFDNNQYLVEEYYKGWRMYQNEYLNGTRTTYNYINELRASVIAYNYLPDTDDWEPKEKQLNYYYNTGMDSIVLNQEWNISTNDWENIKMRKLFCNVEEKDSLRLELIWNMESGLWMNHQKFERFYVDSLSRIELYGSNWDEVLSSWVNDVHVQSYDTESGLTDSTIHYKWNSIIESWEYDRKYIRVFNETEQLLEYKIMVFDNQNSIWMNDFKITYLYNDNNRERITYNGNVVGNDWVPYFREFHSFAYDNVVDTTQYDQWDTISQKWTFYIRYINVFDSRLCQTNKINQTWDSTYDTWQTLSRTDYFWSPFQPLGINETNSMNALIIVYPNPASSSINISVQTVGKPLNLFIEIFDINGRLVLKSKQTTQHKEFDIRHLEKGQYLVRIQNKNSFATKKILIQ